MTTHNPAAKYKQCMGELQGQHASWLSLLLESFAALLGSWSALAWRGTNPTGVAPVQAGIYTMRGAEVDE